MEEQANEEVTAFTQQLVRCNAAMKELFTSGNVALFSEMNKAIKEMHRLQHGSAEAVMQAIEPDCAVIYQNFDMIIALLRTTENGEIDAATQKGLNKLLHNIDEAIIGIASAFGLV